MQMLCVHELCKYDLISFCLALVKFVLLGCWTFLIFVVCVWAVLQIENFMCRNKTATTAYTHFHKQNWIQNILRWFFGPNNKMNEENRYAYLPEKLRALILSMFNKLNLIWVMTCNDNVLFYDIFTSILLYKHFMPLSIPFGPVLPALFLFSFLQIAVSTLPQWFQFCACIRFFLSQCQNKTKEKQSLCQILNHRN